MPKKGPVRYKKRKIKRRGGCFLRLFQFCLIMLLLLILAVVGVGFYFKDDIERIFTTSQEKVDAITKTTFKNKVATRIYDKDENMLQKISPRDYYYVEKEQIPKKFKDAVVSIEDERFYEHKGYDLEAIGRAGVELVKNKGHITQGGSTLTQQLVKLELLTLDKSYERKATEILIAKKLEEKFTKDQILEFYLNNINYGNGAYGFEAASRKYFSKPSKKLSLSQVAFLTAIPNNPSQYNPVRYKKNTLKRRNLILMKMKELGYISVDEYDRAITEKIKLKIKKKKPLTESYEVSFILSSATKILMEKQGFEFKYWFNTTEDRKKYLQKYNDTFLDINQKIRNGGYKLYSTIDMKKQAQLQASINKTLSGYTAKDMESGIYKMQGSAVSIDNTTGDVVAIVGGRYQEDVKNTFNRAFLSNRQPGSVIKPLVVYAPAYENGKLASTVMVDKKQKKGPANATNTYAGAMSLRQATARSVNTVAFKLGIELGPKKMLSYLQEMEFSKLAPADNQVGISIGGFTYGTNALEMASGYYALANHGQYVRQTGLSKIKDVVKNEYVYKNTHKGKQVYDAGAADLALDTMKDVVTQKYGTGKGFGLKNMTTAAKTGTTNKYYDKWFAGVTPYYTTVVWTGYDQPKTIGYKPQLPHKIWKDYNQKIHVGKKNKSFTRSKRLTYMFKNPYNKLVEKKNTHNWWVRELIPEIYYEQQEKRLAEEKRKREEEKRKREEELRKQEEARKKAYIKLLASYDLTEESLKELQTNASEAIKELTAITVIESDYDLEDAKDEIKRVKKIINKIPIKEYRDPYLVTFEAEVVRLEDLETAYKDSEDEESTNSHYEDYLKAKEDSKAEAKKRAIEAENKNKAAEREATEQDERASSGFQNEAIERAKEQAAQAEREALEKAQAKVDKANALLKAKAEREAKEKAAREKAEREAAEKLAKAKAAKEQAEREAREKAAREKLAKEKAEQEAEEVRKKEEEQAKKEAEDSEDTE